MNRRRLLLAALLAPLPLMLAACDPQANIPSVSNRVPEQSALASVMVDSVNYRHDRAMQYTLYELKGSERKPVGGSIVDPLAGGGSKGCCLALPTVWHPGIRLQVEWGEADTEQIFPETYERELELPRYERPADLYVVFYPGHEVEVVVSPAEPGHPEWAGRIRQSPWNACVAEHGRKVCKRAIPKLFDAVSAQGFCIYLRDEWPEDQHLCESAMLGCMQDYEDEEFCNKVLWGPRKK